jgi:hypothetical protein
MFGMKTSCRYLFLTFILWMLLSGNAISQRTPQNPRSDPNQNPIGSSEIDSTETGALPLDTPVAMTYVLLEDPSRLYFFYDTFYWEDARHVPLSFSEAHLGNYGSATRPLAPSGNLTNHFSTGWDQYDPYFFSPDSFRFYNQSIPVAKIKYSQASQEDTYLTLDFGRSFAKGLNLTFVYDRIHQEGKYGHQRQRNTALGIGVFHNPPSGKYDAYYNIISNGAVAEENGGIAAPELIGNPLFPDPSVPVFITGGVTTHQHRAFTMKHIFHLVSDTNDFGIDLWILGHYKSGLFKYADPSAASSTEYYGLDFFFDDRGVRQFTFHEEIQGSAGASLPWRSARSVLRSSLRYRTNKINQEPDNFRVNELFWDASIDFHWIEALQLNGLTSVGLGEGTGAFLFKAGGTLNTDIIGKFSGTWTVMTRKPYLVEDRLFVNQTLIYDNDFHNPFTSEISVEWFWEKLDLKAGMQWLVFDNYIFFSTDRKPQQIQESFSLQRISASKGLDFKWIGIKGSFLYQPDVKEEMAIPEFLYTASAYAKFRIFRKKLTIMPGVDVLSHGGYHGISYFPVTGRYHLTSGNEIPQYFRVDAAVSIHINFLKAFIRMDDVKGFFESRVLYESDYYPHYPGYIRIGLEGSFFN